MASVTSHEPHCDRGADAQGSLHPRLTATRPAGAGDESHHPSRIEWPVEVEGLHHRAAPAGWRWPAWLTSRKNTRSRRVCLDVHAPVGLPLRALERGGTERAGETSRGHITSDSRRPGLHSTRRHLTRAAHRLRRADATHFTRASHRLLVQTPTYSTAGIGGGGAHGRGGPRRAGHPAFAMASRSR